MFYYEKVTFSNESAGRVDSMNACNSSIREAKAEESRVPDQPRAT